MAIFITGTGTGVGKTIVSALILGKYGDAPGISYWKPVQTGTSHDTDTIKIRNLTEISADRIKKSIYCFEKPASPHYASQSAGKKIDTDLLVRDLKATKDEKILIEGAGGVLVPLTDSVLTIDAIANSGIPVIVIASSILGTINHSLLTLEALKSRKIPVLGFFVYGETNDLLENNIETIRRFSGAEFLGAAFVPETISDKKEFMAFAKNMFDSDAKLKRKIFP